MKLTFEQIKDVTVGATNIVFEDRAYKFFRYTDKEAEVISRPNTLAPAGISLSFKTDGDVLKLKVDAHIIDDSSCSYFAFDIFVDGKYLGAIQNIADEDIKGKYGVPEYPLGKYEGEFELGDGEKAVRIVLPHSVVAYIEEVEITGATYVTPVKRKKVIAAYGDSITQGFHAVHPSKSYAARLSDALDADIYNKAYGGASFCPELLEVTETIDADFVLVAYGTNDWYAYDYATIRQKAEAFSRKIKKLYPDTPIYVISPTWRSDWEMEKKGGLFTDVEGIIKEFFANREKENITLIPGRDLIPHDTNLFGDLWLHPNEEGFGHYFNNMIKYFK